MREKKARNWERQGDVIPNSKRLNSSGRKQGRKEELPGFSVVHENFCKKHNRWKNNIESYNHYQSRTKTWKKNSHQ